MKIRNGEVVEGEAPVHVEDHVAEYRMLPLLERLDRNCYCLTRDGEVVIECLFCEALEAIHDAQRQVR